MLIVGAIQLIASTFASILLILLLVSNFVHEQIHRTLGTQLFFGNSKFFPNLLHGF